MATPPAPGRVAARLARQVEVGLTTVELSLAQYRLLMFLADGSAPASDLARGMAVTPPSVTAVADGLVARGLIERRHEAGDRRRVGHVLTTEGQQVLAAADGAVDARLGEIAGFLANEAEAAEAIGGLARWRQALDRYRAAKVAGRA